jgi:transposase InsO family protein
MSGKNFEPLSVDVWRHGRFNSGTRESVELATLEWVAWFNHHRLLEPIGYIPPAKAEANHYRQLANQAAIVA